MAEWYSQIMKRALLLSNKENRNPRLRLLKPNRTKHRCLHTLRKRVPDERAKGPREASSTLNYKPRGSLGESRSLSTVPDNGWADRESTVGQKCMSPTEAGTLGPTSAGEGKDARLKETEIRINDLKQAGNKKLSGSSLPQNSSDGL